MNRKAQINVLGVLLIAFVGIIIGIALFQVVSQTVGDATNTYDMANQSVSSVNATYSLTGQSVSSVVVYNTTGDAIVSSGNYTIANNQVVDGTLTARITVEADAIYQGGDWEVSYTYEPDGYIDSAGGRGVALLIPIFAALAIAVLALVPAFRNGVMDLLGK